MPVVLPSYFVHIWAKKSYSILFRHVLEAMKLYVPLYGYTQGSHRLSAEVGYFLSEPFWGKGITTHALRAAVEYTFANFDIIRIFGTVAGWNHASTKVLEKVGFRHEGALRMHFAKFGETSDELVYGLLRNDAIPTV